MDSKKLLEMKEEFELITKAYDIEHANVTFSDRHGIFTVEVINSEILQDPDRLEALSYLKKIHYGLYELLRSKLSIVFITALLFFSSCKKEYSRENTSDNKGYLIVTKDTTYNCNNVTISFLEIKRKNGNTMWLYPGDKKEFDSLKVGMYFKF